MALPSQQAMVDFPTDDIYNKRIRDLLLERGGADYRLTPLRLHVENLSSDVVDIRNIRAKRTHTASPFRAAKIYHPTAGERTIPYLHYNLDDSEPSAWEMTYSPDTGEWVSEKRPYFTAKYISLQPKETFEIYIFGAAQRIYCEWNLEIDFILGKDYGCIPVHDTNGPFKTSGTPQEGFETDWHWVWWEADVDRRGFYPSSHFPI
ncbi:hypothetical protein LUW74_20755 [Actinomadura madurae]|uniref:hypothetical protein n=1 Tax=Actinomadura madurae TaxID=1993 RepID=UPI0020270AC2|nr:hypothetical protein [Actinomadura madurae]URN05501.1 hypothetical protein LUW74_20755 [Actinomadura madurae]